MKIKKLHIESFRGISKMDFDSFDENVNLFLGENGAGKSTILDAINILLSWLTAKSLNVKGKGRSINGDDVKMGDASCEIQMELDDSTSWKLSKTRNESKSDLSALNEYIVKHFSDEGSYMPVIVYYDVNRYISDIQTERGMSFKDFFAWFRNQEDIENEQRINDSKYRDYKLEAVRNAMAEVFTGYSGLRVRRNPLSLLINKGTETLNLNQLSDGEKCYLTLVCDLARRLADVKSDGNPLEGDGIVLIDEVDLHLHPKWQLEVVSKLKNTFPNCQFFMTTHSPLVASDSDGKTFKIERGVLESDNYFTPYGQSSERILPEMFDVYASRSPRIQDSIDKIYNQIRSNKLDEAQAGIDSLSKIIDRDDKEIIALKLELTRHKKHRQQ